MAIYRDYVAYYRPTKLTREKEVKVLATGMRDLEAAVEATRTFLRAIGDGQDYVFSLAKIEYTGFQLSEDARPQDAGR